ncbi:MULTISPECIES: ABC transporter ATP-binding protein [unclassified Paracoccus (in: a-proteobacteria)]|uniref:ABC transporter ATP-binding protein n=1 Tax=unclassified Paracoccus (in: a-proteobacteria) TaxID=2688777 RepID=UPI0012B1D55A|nr:MULTISPECIES: ABC transporter ATP-binding protein [unclassified Paracoccus (in: a-proteobacteria)]UXU76166.1 ABC transporter ATP-binding protein/permease [Paracoccus sp. SMMA_5]UXU81951.1 ABC transporter ATP-binding protein/permease [Paracoccus sp. SMMA_5_TC]
MHAVLARLIDAFRPAEGPPPRSLLAFFRWCLSGAWPGLAIAAVASALSGLADIVSAVLLGWVIDAVVTTTPDRLIADKGGLIAGFVLFFLVIRPAIFGLSTASSSVIIGPNLFPLVLSRLHRWTMGHAVTFFDNDFAGRIAQKQTQTARAVTDVASEFVNVVAFALASILGSAAFLVSVDGWGAVAMLAWLASYVVLIRFFLPRIRSRSASRASARAMVTGQVVDTITNIKTVKLFAHAEHEDRAALGAMAGFRERALDFGRVSTWFRFSLMLVAGALPVVLIGGTLLLWREGLATAGDIAASGAIAMRLAQMTGWVSMALMGVWGSIGEVEDGMRTLSPPHALTDAPDALALGRVRGDIDFDHVSFAYGRTTGGLDDLSLHVMLGEKVGIVGASGAGKSTLVSLLLRLYDVEAGAVRVDGHDVRAVTQESLRRNIAMVTQETAMFNRSARDNILYGRPDATEDQIIAAARAAEAHDFILGLQDHMGRRGYDAHLGERGVKLSGGQRQRIALARALLKDAPILVLDEATSALDSEVEAQVQQALHRAMQGKTVLAIAHRLSTIAELDRIVVLEAGRIVESGRHAELLARGGTYARYWNRQSGGFLGTEDDSAEAAQ